MRVTVSQRDVALSRGAGSCASYHPVRMALVVRGLTTLGGLSRPRGGAAHQQSLAPLRKVQPPAGANAQACRAHAAEPHISRAPRSWGLQLPPGAKRQDVEPADGEPGGVVWSVDGGADGVDGDVAGAEGVVLGDPEVVCDGVVLGVVDGETGGVDDGV
ncbi:hypothetical protein ABH940_000367 [Streptacidiphilus sp. BW17]